MILKRESETKNQPQSTSKKSKSIKLKPQLNEIQFFKKQNTRLTKAYPVKHFYSLTGSHCVLVIVWKEEIGRTKYPEMNGHCLLG